MFKSVTFRCKLDGINCLNEAELTATIKRAQDAIAASLPAHAAVLIDSNVEVEEVRPDVQKTALGDAQVDGFMKVKRANDGREEFYHNVNGESFAITRDQYEAAHANDVQSSKGRH